MESDNTFAAVPVATGNTRTFVSKSSENFAESPALTSSAPYGDAWPALAARIASMISGATGAVLSLAKSAGACVTETFLPVRSGDVHEVLARTTIRAMRSRACQSSEPPPSEGFRPEVAVESEVTKGTSTNRVSSPSATRTCAVL